MLRRRREEAHENHERWVISYADFITLLFAFFVVMYSISSVNDGKYRVLSDSLVTAFDARSRTLDPVSVGENNNIGDSHEQSMIELPLPGDYPSKEDYRYSIDGMLSDVEAGALRQGDEKKGETDAWTRLSDDVTKALGTLVDKGDARIVDKGEWLEVNIQSSVLFRLGSADLSSQARALLAPVAALMAGKGRQVQVEGHTDNLPIETERFPSNWELSSARAASVVRWLLTQGVAGSALSATGFGEFRPVADNGTEAGRRANRRIAILVSRQVDEKQVAAGQAVAGPAASDTLAAAGEAAGAAAPAGNVSTPATTPPPAERALEDFRLTNEALSRPLPRGGPPVPLRIDRISLEQARERWHIQRNATGGTP